MRARLIGLALVAVMVVGACGGSSKPKASSSTSAPGATTTVTGASGATEPATSSPTAVPLTLPPQAPPGATPFDISGDLLAIDGATHVLALQFGPLPGGLVLIATGKAQLHGVNGFGDLTIGQKVHAAGYGERLGGVRVFTAVDVTVSP